MLFNSLTYIAFMLLAVPLANLSPYVLRRVILLVGSLLFYAFWRVDFTVLVVFSALVDYTASWAMYRTTVAWRRRLYLTISLVMNLGLLVFFKYTYFLVGTTQGIAAMVGLPFEVEVPNIILPLGISFYTFQTISYSIDVYRRQQRPVRDFSLFLTYVMFWPQLVAGPVLRAHEVLPQLAEPRRPNVGDFVHGLEEILHGLFKKVVLADSIAKIVDYGYDLPVESLGPIDVWTLAFAFGLQIYFDFSGYSQIAIGSARVLGFNFPQNFNWPYLAVSPRDFWKRWHISLSAWIRDYLYLPLQGARFRGASTGGIEANAAKQEISFARKNTALFLTWLIMGLWHGASWRFALWGLWHAVMIFVYRVTGPSLGRLPAWLRISGGWCFTIAFAMLGWVFFRATSVDRAIAMVIGAFDLSAIRTLSMRENNYLITFIYFAGFMLVAAVLRVQRDGRVPPLVRYAGLAIANSVMIFGIFLMLREVKQFIYFQF
jgi:D-alanyl-lipoteichoic acid acyltransferase DltB (MBOAT superfamily)